MKTTLKVSSFLAVLLVALVVNASKGDLAVRDQLATFDTEYDKPFRTTAILTGWCTDADIPLSDSRVMKLYHIDSGSAQNAQLELVGKLYVNSVGQESVCVDEASVHPFVVTNVKGDMLTIVGWMTAGSSYDLKDDKIIVVESMEKLGGELE